MTIGNFNEAMGKEDLEFGDIGIYFVDFDKTLVTHGHVSVCPECIYGETHPTYGTPLNTLTREPVTKDEFTTEKYNIYKKYHKEK